MKKLRLCRECLEADDPETYLLLLDCDVVQQNRVDLDKAARGLEVEVYRQYEEIYDRFSPQSMSCERFEHWCENVSGPRYSQ